MDYKKIKILLDKFFNGETSLEEELYIRDTIKDENIPRELQLEKHLFDSYEKLRSESNPDSDLSKELTDLIEDKWKESTREKFQKVLKWTIGAAACIVLGISYFYYNQNPKTIQNTFDNQQEAYVATRQILFYISEKMNTESSKLSSLAYINKSLSAVDKLSEINNVINKYKSKEK